MSPDAATPVARTNADALARLLAEVEQRLGERVEELTAAGRSVDSLGDPAELAERMVAVLPSVHPLDTALGPFYDTTGLVGWLGVSRQALADRVRRGTLLACRTADGHLLYPLFQFARSGEVRAGIAEAVQVLLRAGVDGWTVGSWLTTPSAAFGGDSAVDHLVVHRQSRASVARVVAAATADARRWAT